MYNGFKNWATCKAAVKNGTKVYAVVPYRGDGKYTIDQAIRTFKMKHAAEKFADQEYAKGKDYVVRTVDTKKETT